MSKKKGKREEPIEKAEENDGRGEYGTTTGMPEGTDVWWDNFVELEVLLHRTMERKRQKGIFLKI